MGSNRENIKKIIILKGYLKVISTKFLLLFAMSFMSVTIAVAIVVRVITYKCEAIQKRSHKSMI